MGLTAPPLSCRRVCGEVQWFHCPSYCHWNDQIRGATRWNPLLRVCLCPRRSVPLSSCGNHRSTLDSCPVAALREWAAGAQCVCRLPGRWIRWIAQPSFLPGECRVCPQHWARRICQRLHSPAVPWDRQCCAAHRDPHWFFLYSLSLSIISVGIVILQLLRWEEVGHRGINFTEIILIGSDKIGKGCLSGEH